MKTILGKKSHYIEIEVPECDYEAICSLVKRALKPVPEEHLMRVIARVTADSGCTFTFIITTSENNKIRSISRQEYTKLDKFSENMAYRIKELINSL